MNEEFWRWYMYGHWVCLTQWLGFIMVEYAYLGKGKVKHPLVWSGVITMLTMTLSVVHNYGFFTPMAVALTLLFLFITVMLFGGTPGQKFTACLINGTMCLLVENSMRYVISWILKCELQQVIQRADCLIIIAVANMVVGAAVAFWVSKWRRPLLTELSAAGLLGVAVDKVTRCVAIPALLAVWEWRRQAGVSCAAKSSVSSLLCKKRTALHGFCPV